MSYDQCPKLLNGYISFIKKKKTDELKLSEWLIELE
jgi:hypothetical protein